MQYITKLKLAAVHQLCDAQDRSTEYMIQYMIDTCKVEHDCVMSYLLLGDKELNRLAENLNSLLEVFILIEESEV